MVFPKMKKKTNKNDIILQVPEAIEVKPNKEKKNIKAVTHNFGVVYERRNPKVVIDEYKVFGTKQNHKYY